MITIEPIQKEEFQEPGSLRQGGKEVWGEVRCPGLRQEQAPAEARHPEPLHQEQRHPGQVRPGPGHHPGLPVPGRVQATVIRQAGMGGGGAEGHPLTTA